MTPSLAAELRPSVASFLASDRPIRELGAIEGALTRLSQVDWSEPAAREAAQPLRDAVAEAMESLQRRVKNPNPEVHRGDSVRLRILQRYFAPFARPGDLRQAAKLSEIYARRLGMAGRAKENRILERLNGVAAALAVEAKDVEQAPAPTRAWQIQQTMDGDVAEIAAYAAAHGRLPEAGPGADPRLVRLSITADVLSRREPKLLPPEVASSELLTRLISERRAELEGRFQATGLAQTLNAWVAGRAGLHAPKGSPAAMAVEFFRLRAESQWAPELGARARAMLLQERKVLVAMINAYVLDPGSPRRVLPVQNAPVIKPAKALVQAMINPRWPQDAWPADLAAETRTLLSQARQARYKTAAP